MKSVIDILDLSVEEIDLLIATAEDIMKNPYNYSSAMKGKKLATLFFEPSTRTRPVSYTHLEPVRHCRIRDKLCASLYISC